MSTRLVVPANITIILLPPKCPEFNPVENVWQFMRENWLSNRVFKIIRRSRRPLLRGLEQARRSALAHHVHRIAPMGPPVLINGIWYNLQRARSIPFGLGLPSSKKNPTGRGPEL